MPGFLLVRVIAVLIVMRQIFRSLMRSQQRQNRKRTAPQPSTKVAALTLQKASKVSSKPIDLNDLYTVDEYAALYPRVLSRATLRYQLRNRDDNGLAAVCVRLGKKLLISHTRYQQWLADSQEVAAV